MRQLTVTTHTLTAQDLSLIHISILTEEERRIVDAVAQQIDLTNSSMILQYGAGTQKKMADFSESALEM